jgi:L-threonate 2-dehydrogenase
LATQSVGTVGVIGLGIMGSAMAANLVKAGWRVVGYDVLPAARDRLRAEGGVPARSIAEVVKAATIIITSLPTYAAVEGVARELADTKARGHIIVETSTMPIAVKEAARVVLAKAGITLLDCPLSGTGAQARNKDLGVYASGPLAAYKQCVPAFEGFASAHYHVGEFGAGSKMKFIANHLVAIHNVAAAEAMVLAMKGGLDPAMVLKVVAGGAGGSRMFQVRGPMMVADDYSEATMKCEVWQKDMEIIGRFATDLDCPVPLFHQSASIYNAAMAQGHAKDDTAAVCAVLANMAGLKRKVAPARKRRAAK